MKEIEEIADIESTLQTFSKDLESISEEIKGLAEALTIISSRLQDILNEK